MFIFNLFGILFIIFAIVFWLIDIKERELFGIEILTTFLIYMFFGVSMSLFIFFIPNNPLYSVIIILILFSICMISSLIRELSYVSIVVLLCSLAGLVMCFQYILNLNVSYFLWWPIGMGCYLLPLLGCLDRKISVIKKIDKCNYEINATVIKVIYRKKKNIYIPRLEFDYNGKTYRYMNADYLVFNEEIKVGDVIPLFIDPYSKKFNKNSDSVFFPRLEIKSFLGFEDKLWYGSSIFIAIVIWLLYKFC